MLQLLSIDDNNQALEDSPHLEVQ